MTLADLSDDVATDLSASALFVLHVLIEADRPLTTIEIAERTRLDERTIRFAVEKLRDVDLVESKPSVQDARKTIHALVDI
jgi:predicted transcriptional regulator